MGRDAATGTRAGAALSWLIFTLAVFATYYSARAISQEDGPFGVFDKLRLRWNSGYLGKGVRCIVCVSAYSAFVWMLLLGWLGQYDPWLWPIVWLGLAGAATKLHEYWSRG